MRQLVSTALVALIVAALTAVTVGAVAQQPLEQQPSGQPPATSAEPAITTAGLNADTVDGRHAVKFTAKKARRKNRLMALSPAGYLPPNIVKGRVATLAALRSPAGAVNETDNPVHWNQLKGVPPAVIAGDTTTSIIGMTTPLIAPHDSGLLSVAYPPTIEVYTSLIPVASDSRILVGLQDGMDVYPGEVIARSDAEHLAKLIYVVNLGDVATQVRLRVTIWNDSYISPAAARKLVKVTFSRKVPDSLVR